MNEFTETFNRLVEEEEGIRKMEADLKSKAIMFTEKMSGFLKQHGLPENFGMMQLGKLIAEKYDKSPLISVVPK